MSSQEELNQEGSKKAQVQRPEGNKNAPERQREGEKYETGQLWSDLDKKKKKKKRLPLFRTPRSRMPRTNCRNDIETRFVFRPFSAREEPTRVLVPALFH